MFTEREIRDAAQVVYGQVSPTPQYRWPLLEQRAGFEIWVKHENHTPTGAFKVRGGVTFIDWLRREHPDARGIVTATRGNHGQSQARAATAAGLKAVIYVPRGNAVEKNRAMRAFGADLREFGSDFDEARVEAERVAQAEGLFLVPAFHRELVRGVASYALELFDACGDFDAVYVPIGCGSGACAVLAARDALGASAEVVGVVSELAPAVKRSVESGRPSDTASADTFADGVAVRVVVPQAFDYYSGRLARVVSVSEDEVAEAIRAYYVDTHNVAEGAGAAALAAALQERERNRDRKVAVILCGGNLDADKLGQVLAGRTPAA